MTCSVSTPDLCAGLILGVVYVSLFTLLLCV